MFTVAKIITKPRGDFCQAADSLIKQEAMKGWGFYLDMTISTPSILPEW